MRNTAAAVVLAVLGLAGPAAADRYSTAITGTVADSYTALMWQRQSDGQTRTWRAALAYCEALTLAGFADWRLPDVKELRSLIPDAGFDVTAFPGTTQGGYWTSTSRAGSPNFGWYVGFPGGAVYTDFKFSPELVRCVR